MRLNRVDIQQKEYLNAAGRLCCEYHFYLRFRPEPEYAIYIGGLSFPGDRQYLFDSKALDTISKAIAVRWGLIQPRQGKQASK